MRPVFRMSNNKGYAKKATTHGFQRKKPRIEDEDPDAAQPSSSPLSPALLIMSPRSPPSFSGPTGESFFFFALFFFLSNTPHCLRCSQRCPRVHACFIHAPRQFTFFVFGPFRTERDPFRVCAAHRCVYFLRRFFVFFQSNTLLFFRFPCALLCTVTLRTANLYKLTSPMVEGVWVGD